MCRVLTVGLLIGFLMPNVAMAQRGFFQRQNQHQHQHHHYCPHCQKSGLAAEPALVNETNAIAPAVPSKPDSPEGSVSVPAKPVVQEEKTKPQVEQVTQPVTESDEQVEAAVSVLVLPPVDQDDALTEVVQTTEEEGPIETDQEAAPPLTLSSLPDGAAFARAAAIATEQSQPQAWQGRILDTETYDDSHDEIACAPPQTSTQASDKMGLGWFLTLGLFPLGWLAFAARGSRERGAVHGGTAAVTSKQIASSGAVVGTAAAAESGKSLFVKDDFESGVLKNGDWETTGATQSRTKAVPATVATSGYGSLGTCRPAATSRDAPVMANERTTGHDDFTVIEGVCPRAEHLLYDAEITSYAELAETDAECRMKAMIPGGSRFSSKNTRHWPEAARELVPAPAAETKEKNAPEYRRAAWRGDDLTQIEGICPETQQLLYDAGIYNYTDLASTDAETFADALACGGSRFEALDTAEWSDEAQARVARQFDPVFLRCATEEAQSRSKSGNSGDSWVADESHSDIQLDDLTKIDTVDEDAQQAIYSAGVFEFGDLAVADRVSLKRTMVQYDSTYASFDVDRCCDQAMHFVPENFWQGEEVQLHSELNDTQQETPSKSSWNGISDGVKRGKSAFAAKLEELDGNAEHLLTRDGSTDLEKFLTARVKSCWNVVSDGVKRGSSAFAAKLEELDGNAEPLLTRDGSTDLEKFLTARVKSCWNVVSDGVKRGSEWVVTSPSARMDGVDAQQGSYATVSCESQLDGLSAGNGQRDDLTKIDAVDEDLQEAIYSAGVFEFSDLAVADRSSLKRSITEYDSKYASFDVDGCCDQAMDFVPEDFWQSEEAEELHVLEELNDMNQEMTRFKSWWSSVSDRAKSGSSKVLAKMGGEK